MEECLAYIYIEERRDYNIGEHMAEHAKTQNLLNQPRITLIARFFCGGNTSASMVHRPRARRHQKLSRSPIYTKSRIPAYQFRI